MKEKTDYQDRIYTSATIAFKIMDRIKLLFSGRLYVMAKIDCEIPPGKTRGEFISNVVSCRVPKERGMLEVG